MKEEEQKILDLKGLSNRERGRGGGAESRRRGRKGEEVKGEGQKVVAGDRKVSQTENEEEEDEKGEEDVKGRY